MYMVRVIPITKGGMRGELSYYSVEQLQPGTIVHIPLRKKEVPALVTGSEAVRAVKSEIRTAGFQLRKLKPDNIHTTLEPALLKAAERTAAQNASSVGAVLVSFLPRVLLESPALTTERAPPQEHNVVRTLQATHGGRHAFYRSTIRETFAHNTSVFLLCPTIEETERCYALLRRGIEEQMFMLHSGVPFRAQQTAWQRALTHKHPVAVVGTYSYLSLPRSDLHTIIIEREGSPQYRLPTRSHADARGFADELVRARGGTLYLADLPLRIETVHATENETYERIVTGEERSAVGAPTTIVDMTRREEDERRPFTALHPNTLEEIRAALEEDGRVFVYATRRGLAPLTLCEDCGASVECRECGASVVLHTGDKENYFLCHSCGTMRSARERCVVCDSWRLTSLGIGIELVERELRAAFPEVAICNISKDATSTHRQACKVANVFYGASRSILIGTEMALPYLREQVDLSVVASLDSLLSVPAWNMYERIASILTRIREYTSEAVLVQTRRASTELLTQVLFGKYSNYYRRELALREEFGYPPFTTVVKFTLVGNEDTIRKRLSEVRAAVGEHELHTLTRFLHDARGRLVMHAYLHLPRAAWPDTALHEKLVKLPPDVSVTVDPDTIL